MAILTLVEPMSTTATVRVAPAILELDRRETESNGIGNNWG
jgi:hypothetical protein